MGIKARFFLKNSLWRSVRHQIALFVGLFRKPGRFSIYHYNRAKAFARLKDAKSDKVLDLGAGSQQLASHVVGIDLLPGECVNIAADVAKLPVKSGVCEGVWMGGFMEHVPDPAAMLNESWRVLKPTGWIYCEVPFLQGEHNAPGDYQRWTRQGLCLLFKSWEIEWVVDVSGPFSALAYQLRTCLSILTSFRSDLLYRILFEAFWGYVVWPIKFLDALFIWHPRAQSHAFGFGIMARKKKN